MSSASTNFNGLKSHKKVIYLQELIKVETSVSIPKLREILFKDNDSIVRHEAAFFLGEIGDLNGVQTLILALQKDSSPLVRHEAAEALGWIQCPESIESLKEALKDKNEEVRITAQISLNILQDNKI